MFAENEEEHKKEKGLPSFSFDMKRFVSAKVEARFYDSVKRRSGLKKRGLGLEPPYMARYKAVIISRGWHVFCKQPKVAAMTIVWEFYVNAFES